MSEQNIQTTEVNNQVIKLINEISLLGNNEVLQLKDYCSFLLRQKKLKKSQPGRPKIYFTNDEAKQAHLEKMRKWREKQKLLSTITKKS